MTTKAKKQKAAPRTDVDALQLAMAAQIPPSERFHTTLDGNQLVISDSKTGRKALVGLFAARETMKALEDLFGKDEWDLIRHPDLSVEENEIVRRARRKGYATFFPGGNGKSTLNGALAFLGETLTVPFGGRIRIVDSLGNISYLIHHRLGWTYCGKDETPYALCNIVRDAVQFGAELNACRTLDEALTLAKKHIKGGYSISAVTP